MSKLSEYLTVDGLVDAYPHLLKESQVRWALRFRYENGLAAHCIRMGRRLYIHVPGFVEWFQAQGREG